jgi:undecaprenyl-diphosphatase
MPWITHLGDPSIVWIWIIGMGLLRVKQFARPTKTTLSNIQKYKLYMQVGLFFCIFLALIYGVTAGVYNGLKHLVNRPRPFEQQHVMLRVSSSTASDLSKNGSFPSGHASNAFMVAAFLSACIKRKPFVFYGFAGLVALSRIYLGVHFPSDVFMGAFLGWGITRLMLSSQWLKNRITREKIFLSQQLS